MAEKKAQIIIKKIKKGGHGGHHGGAWKVAYADFVTAMMCFFLVMWLMGADEETKKSIEAYFNNPWTPEAWRRDLTDKDQAPLGARTGSGDTVLKGAQGLVPEDMVQRPQLPQRNIDSVGPTESTGLLSNEDIEYANSLSFASPEYRLFSGNSVQPREREAERSLRSIQRIAKNFHGRLTIRSTYDDSIKDGYDFQISRLTRLKQLMVERRWLGEDLITVTTVKAPSVREDTPENRKYEFTFVK